MNRIPLGTALVAAAASLFPITSSAQARFVDASRTHLPPPHSVPQSSVDHEDRGIGRTIDDLRLDVPFPNPFTEAVTIRHELRYPAEVCVEIYTPAGKHVATVQSGHRNAGEHEVLWTGDNVAAGTYVFKVHAGELVRTGSIICLPITEHL